jgi:hypothetical protein
MPRHRGGGIEAAASSDDDGSRVVVAAIEWRHRGCRLVVWWRRPAPADWWQAGRTDRPTGWSVPPSEGIAAIRLDLCGR